MACIAAAAGAAIAGFAGSLAGLWLGYSLVFGAANGLGYGYGLQLAAKAMPGREGLAMGIVTASYALGSVVSPPLFASVLDASGFTGAMVALALVLVAVGAVSAALVAWSGAAYRTAQESDARADTALWQQVLLWLGYFGGVVAGLMVIGHAASIAQAAAPHLEGWHAVVIIAASNLIGSLLGGRAVDLAPADKVLAALALATCGALLTLALTAFDAGSR